MMKTNIRNFLCVIRRFRMATLLNVLGLSVAFTVVIAILMQVSYDLNFDGNQPERDHIYRIEAEFQGRKIAILPRPLVDGLEAYSPHVKAAAIVDAMASDLYDWFVAIEKDGNKHYYSEKTMQISGDFIDVFRFDMMEGQAEQFLEPDKILIPESMAKKMFGNESSVNKQITVDKQNYTVAGVFRDFPKNSSTPNAIYMKISDESNKGSWNMFNYAGYVRIDPSVSMDELLKSYVDQIDPALLGPFGEMGFYAVPLKQVHFNIQTEFDAVKKASRQTLWILIAIAFIILLIAAINFTNYSIALTPLRIKSINTQKVLGASENKLRSSLVTEAVITCMLSWSIALFFTYLLSMTSIAQIIDADMNLMEHVGLLSGVGLIAFLVGIFAGTYPAFYTTSFTPALVLKGSFGLSPKGSQLRNGLVSIQFVASLALVVVALFMYLQVNFMQKKSLGFDKDQVIVTNLNDVVAGSRSSLVNELTANPAIESISYSDVLLSTSDSYSTWSRKIKETDRMFQVVSVDTGFLHTMGINLLDGRDLRSSDRSEREQVFIFNEKARNDFGLSLGDKTEDNSEIIGFIPDITITSLRKNVEPMAFILMNNNYSTGYNYAYIRVKAGSDMGETFQYIRATLDRLSPGYPFNVHFYDQIVSDLYQSENRLMSLIFWFSFVAVLISMVGVFGLVVFESEYKRKEIGIRKVLGSTTQQILLMFNKRYAKILVVCFIIAAPIAWYAVSLWLENFAYRTPVYWWVFVLSFLMITTITISTVTFQSWQVASANPVDSIKTE